ncbi:MAG: response regulator [Desulfobacteraceae bacterium]|nr:MAG: response regulator [Desulfobacteraceae bacterium]
MPKTALVVDNDFFFVEFLGELLEKRGYVIIKAYDGKEGISKIQNEKIDLMFADIVMPKIDGSGLISFVRTKYPEKCFPIVAVSGTIIEHLGSLNKIGADHYIAKGPMEKMAAKVNELMDKIDSNSFAAQDTESIMESGTLFPRREAVDLLDSLHFHKSIIDCLGIGVIILDADTRILGVNKAVMKILNRNTSELINYLITDIFSNDDKPLLVNALKKIIHNQDLDNTEFTTITASGKTRVIVTLLIVDDKKIGWILALEDYNKWEKQA